MVKKKQELKLKITKISNGEKAQELSEKLIALINEYNEFLTGFEVVGVIDAVRMNTHDALTDDKN